MSIKKTVFLVDDHPVVRQGCKAILSERNDITVVGEAPTGLEALEQISLLKPTIVIMDLNLPDLSGIEIVRRLKAQPRGLHIVILSVHVDDVYVHRALEAGASAYVVKEGAVQELGDAIDAVTAGHMYLSPVISRTVIRTYLQRPARSPSSESETLTVREQEVLQLVAAGLSSKEIAQRFRTSPRTVETHRRNIMQKLDLHNVSELVRYAIRHKLIRGEE